MSRLTQNYIKKTFDKINGAFATAKSELATKFETDKGVEGLMTNYAKQQVAANVPFFGMNIAEVKDFRDKLMPDIDFKEVNIHALARNDPQLSGGIRLIGQAALAKHFGTPIPNTPHAYTLDKTKLTPERIKTFGHDVSQKVAKYSQQLELAERTFKQCEEKGVKFSPEQKEKIMKSLTPTLEALGSDHLEKYMDVLANDLSSKLKDNRSLFSRLTGNSSVSTANLDKIATQLSKEQMPQAEKAAILRFRIK